MATILSLEIGTLAFFAFSFIAGIFIMSHAIFRSKKDTVLHRAVKGGVGAVYAVITVLAFLQLEGVQSPYVDVQSPYVDTGEVETGVQEQATDTETPSEGSE